MQDEIEKQLSLVEFQNKYYFFVITVTAMFLNTGFQPVFSSSVLTAAIFFNFLFFLQIYFTKICSSFLLDKFYSKFCFENCF